jgi:translocator protein
MDYAMYYQSIVKPFFAPPAWVFGVAWGIIYPLIVVAFIWFLILLFQKRVPVFLLWVFLINLAANFAFTPILLTLKNPILATADILLVLATLIFFEYKIYQHSKPIFFLLIPYLLWGTLATVLQISIVFLN